MVIQKNIDRLYSFIAGVLVWVIALYVLYVFQGSNLEILPQSLLFAYFAMYFVNFIHFRKYAINGVN